MRNVEEMKWGMNGGGGDDGEGKKLRERNEHASISSSLFHCYRYDVTNNNHHHIHNIISSRTEFKGTSAQPAEQLYGYLSNFRFPSQLPSIFCLAVFIFATVCMPNLQDVVTANPGLDEYISISTKSTLLRCLLFFFLSAPHFPRLNIMRDRDIRWGMERESQVPAPIPGWSEVEVLMMRKGNIRMVAVMMMMMTLLLLLPFLRSKRSQLEKRKERK